MNRRKTEGNLSNYCVNEFLKAKRLLTNETQKAYEITLKQFPMPLYVNDIDQNLIVEWVLQMKGRGLKEESINHYLTHFRAFLKWCVDNNLMSHCPKITLLKGQKEMMKFYDEDCIRKLLVKPAKDCSFLEHRNYVIVCILLGTGARAQTVTNIHIKDINFKEGLIYCRHTKNKEFLTLPISGHLHKVLSEYLNTWEFDTRKDILLCTQTGDQMTVNGMYQALEDYFNSKNVDYKGIHAFRHTFAREYILNGGNVCMLQQILGHKTLQQTMNYVKLFSEDKLKDIDLFSPLDKHAANRSQAVHRKA